MVHMTIAVYRGMSFVHPTNKYTLKQLKDKLFYLNMEKLYLNQSSMHQIVAIAKQQNDKFCYLSQIMTTVHHTTHGHWAIYMF